MPPDIANLFKQMSTGKPLSPADQAKLKAWMQHATPPASAAPGAASPLAVPAAANPLSSDVGSNLSDEQINAELCRKDGHATLIGAKVSQDQYLAMAHAVQATYSAQIDSQALFALKYAIEAKHYSNLGGLLAEPLLARMAIKEAIVSAAIGADRAHKDPVTANNLGAALRSMKDYANAAIALNYAKTLAPDSPIVASNLGSLAVSFHDVALATRYYDAALSKEPTMAVPLAQLGLFALCAKKDAMAIKYFRASLKGGFSRLAAAGLSSAEDAVLANDASADIGSVADDVAAEGGGAGSAESGGVTKPSPFLPIPPIAADVGKLVAWSNAANPDGIWNRTWSAEAARQNGLAKSLIKPTDGEPITTVSGNHAVFQRGYRKELFLLGDILRITARDLAKAQAQDEADFERYDAILHRQPLNGSDNCAITRQIVMANYPGYAKQANADWVAISAAWDDTFKLITPVLAQIRDDDLRNQLFAFQESYAFGEEASFATEQSLVQNTSDLYLQRGARACELSGSDVPSKPIPPRPLKAYGADACKIHEGMNFGVASMAGDCDKLNVDLLIVGFSVKWGKDESEDQWTFWRGVALSESAGPVSAGLKGGQYATFQNGQLIDTGFIGQTSLSVGAGPASLSSETNIKISDNPDNNSFSMHDGVISGGSMFSQTNSFKIEPPGIPDMNGTHNL